jgi:amino acid permease
MSIIFCWFFFFVVLAFRNEYDPGSKNYKQINIIVWIFGFLGPGLTLILILLAIYSCILNKPSKREPLLNPQQDNIPTAIRIDSPMTTHHEYSNSNKSSFNSIQ